MESIYTELALYGSKKECARTDNVFLPISEVCDGTVFLVLDLQFTNWGEICLGVGGYQIFSRKRISQLEHH